ncbi:TonB-dependent receptor [Rhodobacter sp. SGA-6-6]|uniref:TonB-dependent receptor plug domain-containing protein n=1 Tax=Rhodobacter sp. SGA-6-6 TaxID=2710882 RepID=UPI0013EDA002|nr:TonB-dependent receptor [Rhodobacter sp. SGA-6-6]NGM46510.1 TonB-dependent receptor [Rhodobacter sp. SGA-6-6]
MQGISRLALWAALAATPALAQEEETFLGTITLTALRTAFEDIRTGVSVSVVTEEDLEEAGDIQLSSYLSRLPGISVVQNGPMGTQTKLGIRGASSRYVAVYIDGIRVDDPTGIATEFDFGALSTADVGRVEVLRGSQSALWGGSAVGGVINITTRAALEGGLHQSVAVEGGSYGTASLRYSLGYKDDRIETAFTASRIHSDGFSSYDTKPRDPSLEADGYDATRLSFSTRYRVSDTLAIGFSVFGQDAENEYDGYADIDGDGWEEFTDTTTERQDRREFGGRLFAEYEMGNSEHLFEATRYRISRDDEAAGLVSTFTGERLGFGYRGTTEISQTLTLVYGADWMEETATNAALPAGESTRIGGIYLQGIWSPSDVLDLSLSLRHDEHSSFGSQPSGRIALAWQAMPDLTLRAAASTGFRAPSLYELYGDPSWSIGPNPDLTAEESRSFEIGADYRVGERADLSVTLLAVDTDDAITYCGDWAPACLGTLPPGSTNMYENVPGTSKRRGIELSGDVALSDAASLGLSYTYTDARGPTGARLGRVPFHSLALTLTGDLSDRLSGHVGLQHVSGRPAEFGTPLDDYTVVNVGASYDLTETTELSMRVENVFDRDYQILPGYGTSGRAAYLGLQMKF